MSLQQGGWKVNASRLAGLKTHSKQNNRIEMKISIS
jgi:hypothetical protein